MAQLPNRIGRYPILGLLATGGMAEILLGKVMGPSGFERPVVIKRVLPHLARQRKFVEMFLDEARIVASIRHANVVHVHELGRDGEELFLIMEYLEGESSEALLRRLRTRKKPLPYALAAHIVAEACAGLHVAHELCSSEGVPQDLVHRDVSPHNLFLSYSGQVKVIDFGIARAADRIARTATGMAKGKFPYMSPEQCVGSALDRRSDIFSLGTVLFELSTGRRLFKRKNELLTFKAICSDPIVRPSELVSDFPPSLESIIERALARKRSERFSTAAEMRRELSKAVRTLPLEDAPTDALSALMTELFPERIEQKAEMLRRVQRGSDITSVPAAEIDEDVHLPVVADTADPQDAGSEADLLAAAAVHGISTEGLGVQTKSSAAAELKRGRRARGPWVVGGVLAAVAAGALAASMGDDDGQASEAAQIVATSSTREPTEASAGAGAADSADAQSEVGEVTILVATDPAGATVTVNGVNKGSTPVEFTLPRSTTPVVLEMKRSGYQSVTENIVPTVDVRLQLTLKRAARPRPRPATAPQPRPRDFRRFE